MVVGTRSAALSPPEPLGLVIVDEESAADGWIAVDAIEELAPQKKSLMPEGFEKQVAKADIVHLLEFLTARGKYLPLDLSKAAILQSPTSTTTGPGRG